MISLIFYFSNIITSIKFSFVETLSFNPFQDEAYSFTQSKKVRVEVKRKVLNKFKFGRVFSNSEKQVSKETEIMNFIGQRAADELWLALTFVRLIKLYLDR